ncbi:MAG: hypothetical protein PHQ11_00755 [Paludibacter sp.]|nr:hypothetical protein [Paludibacter sp.]MDD4198036.1 hypothetical protein [Paludibacter sp.]MDD4427011.1 hypothetical protein [Paludibacter sp.]
MKTTGIQGDVTVQVTGEMYTVSVSTISQASAEKGYNLVISFNSSVNGDHSDKISISGGGLPEAFEINLIGNKY